MTEVGSPALSSILEDLERNSRNGRDLCSLSERVEGAKTDYAARVVERELMTR